jgi:hypothetical protein
VSRTLALLLATLAAAQVHAQAFRPPAVPVNEPPGTGNTVLIIRAVGLAKPVAVMVNGTRAAELKDGETFTAVYSPGHLQFSLGSDHPVDSYAIANEELVYELKDVPAAGSRTFLSSGEMRPALQLKERKSIVAGYKPPPPPPAEIKSQAVATSDLLGAQKQAVARRADPGAWRELGRHYLAAGETAKASRAYKEALRLQPGDAATIEVLEKIERK